EFVVGLLDVPWQIVHCLTMYKLPCQTLALPIKKVSVNFQKSSKDVPLVPPPFRFAASSLSFVYPPLVRSILCLIAASRSSPALIVHSARWLVFAPRPRVRFSLLPPRVLASRFCLHFCFLLPCFFSFA